MMVVLAAEVTTGADPTASGDAVSTSGVDGGAWLEAELWFFESQAPRETVTTRPIKTPARDRPRACGAWQEGLRRAPECDEN